MVGVLFALLSASVSFAAEDDLRLKPLPPEAHPGATALDYHSIPVNLKGPFATEKLVSIRSKRIAGDNQYRKICSNDGSIWCRTTVAEKLLRVNKTLKPYGLELYLFDGYRPVECQTALWAHFTNIAKETLKTEDQAAVRQFAGRFCSDPTRYNITDSTTWPTHVTGGAVDLTLRRLGTKELLPMGSAFDEASRASYTNAFEQSSEDVRRNRRLLYWAMRSEGFANYPYEWWHYDYGTQMWVRNSRGLPDAPKVAIYGPAITAKN